jgi:GT2 family glycosyltransferase
MDVSVVIVNWNTRGLLLECLAAIRAQDWKDLTHEVIVVDNASIDGSAAAVTALHPEAHLIENRRPLGFTRGVNQGVAASRGRTILLASPDATPRTPEAVRTLLGALEAGPGIAMVAPRYLYPDGTFQRMYNGFPTVAAVCLATSPLRRFGFVRRTRALREYFLDGMDFDRPGMVPQPAAAFVLMTRAALEVVGPWDEGFPVYFSDVDWCRRAWSCGFTIRYVPDVTVAHIVGAATTKMGEQQWMHSVASCVRYFRKHGRPLDVRILQVAIAASLVAEKVLLAIGTLRRRRRSGPRYRLRDISRSLGGQISGFGGEEAGRG